MHENESLVASRPYCSLTKMAAIPIPEPIHMLVQKILLPVCFAMLSPVATCLAPASSFQSVNIVSLMSDD